MRFHGLDLNLLVVLDTLLTERSITTTAQRLHRTQPAISAALGRLRTYFDDDLFVLNGRMFAPTPLALTLAKPVREALEHIQSAVIGREKFDPSASSRNFKIIMSDYIATVLFSEVVREVAQVAPSVTFELIQFDDNFDAPLNRAEVDLLIFPSIFMTDRHPSSLLFEEEMVAVRCARQSARPLDFDAYFASPHIVARFGKTRKPSVEEFLLTEVGLRRRVEVVAPNFGVLPYFVTGTNRIATMHRRFAEHFSQLLPLTIDPLPFTLPAIRESLQWPQLNDKDPATVWLRNLLISHAARF